MPSDEQIKEKFTIFATETEKYASMYRNFDNEILNLVLCLGNLLKLIINRQQKQNLLSGEEELQYIKIREALHQLNNEVLAFCVYNEFIIGKQQSNEFYKKIPNLIEPHKKTLPFLKDLKILIENTGIFQEGENIIGINFNVLSECYRSLYKIITEVRLVKPLRDFHSAIENLQQKYSQQIDYKTIEQDLFNILNAQQIVPNELRMSEYYISIDWKFFEVVARKYKTLTHNEEKRDILNHIKDDIFNFSLHIRKVTLLVQNLSHQYYTEEINISEFKPQSFDYLEEDYKNYIPSNFAVFDNNQYSTKECNKSLLPLTQHLKSSVILMTERTTFHIPFRFEVTCLLPEDFPIISTDDVQYVQKAIKKSLQLEKSNQMPDQKVIKKWQEKINEFKASTKQKYFPLIAHLQILNNFWVKDKLESDLQSDHHSLQWNKACEIYNYISFKKTLTNGDLAKFIETIVLSKLQAYTENISILIFNTIVSYYVGSFNLDLKLFQIWRNKLQQSPNDIVDANKSISDFIVNGAESNYANKIHEYTKNLLVNINYFQGVYSPLLLNLELIKQSSVIYTYDITLSITPNFSKLYNFIFNKLELLKFSSHLTMISHPKVLLEIENLSPELQNQYSKFVIMWLQKEEYVNSEGMIIGYNVYKNYGVEPKSLEISERFIKSLLQSRVDFAKGKLKINLKPVGNQEILKLKPGIENQLRELEFNKKLISSFGQFQSLALMSATIAEIRNPNIDKIEEIQRLVKDCFSIAYINDGRFKNDKLSEIRKHELAFNLSGLIVDEFFHSKNSFIFQVLTPTQDHAFYIAIKNIFFQNKFQIMIVNGAGLDLHEPDPSITNNEYRDPTHGGYRIMGSELLDKTMYKDFLQHYIYRVLTFRYTSEVNNEKHIYLLRDVIEGIAKFSGFQGESFNIPKGLSLDLLFRAQTSENCTIHNLKNCIRHLLDMSISEYAMFESELLKGADKMLVELLKTSVIETKVNNEEIGDIGSIYPIVDSSINTPRSLTDLYVCPAAVYSVEHHNQDLFSDFEIINPINDFDN